MASTPFHRRVAGAFQRLAASVELSLCALARIQFEAPWREERRHRC